MKKTISSTMPLHPWFYLKNWCYLWVPLICISSISIFSTYQQNISDVSLQDLSLPLILNLLVATIIAAACIKLFLKNKFVGYLTAIIVTTIATTTFQTQFHSALNTVNALLPFQLPDWLFWIFYVVLIVWVVYFLVTKLEAWIQAQKFIATKEVMGAVTIAIFTIFLAEFIPASRELIAAWPQYFYTPTPVVTVNPSVVATVAKPDVYYILLEDYASQDVLKNQMNYDNSPFLSYLSGEGFYNVPGAYANYPYTVNSVASTFNAGYLSDQTNKFSAAKNQTLIPYFATVRNSSVIQQLKDMGYTYDLLGDWYETSNYSPLADATYTNNRQVEIFNHTYGLNEFGNNEIQQNAFWNFLTQGINLGSLHLFDYTSQSDIDAITSQLATLKQLASAPPGGRFIFSQILLPHNEFYFNADGSLSNNPDPNNQGELASQKYTDNVQFIDQQIEPVISEIMQKSGGKADIILQSDEGPQPLQMKLQYNSVNLNQSTTDMSTWSTADLQMKFGVLASYYIPGASQSDLATAANPINIFRLLFNTNYKTSAPYLPLCYYGFPQGENEAFVYQNINQKLTGTANSSCPENGNFINPGPTQLLNNSHPVSATNGDDD